MRLAERVNFNDFTSLASDNLPPKNSLGSILLFFIARDSFLLLCITAVASGHKKTRRVPPLLESRDNFLPYRPVKCVQQHYTQEPLNAARAQTQQKTLQNALKQNKN